MSRLRQTPLRAAEATGNVQRACADARRPLDRDLEMIARSVTGFDGLRDRLASAANSTITDGTMAALQQTLDHVVAASSQRRQILAPAHLEGRPVPERGRRLPWHRHQRTITFNTKRVSKTNFNRIHQPTTERSQLTRNGIVAICHTEVNDLQYT
ncbi:hypothetical protein OG884_07690 [Streptosporangium sp. NBC_01755]|uniref:hypothetical protein n=1 Tax=Streptosporangium sp. NBC_01755 TaxID=2975949 RepID=UPI002DDA646F|nr:hypothetical protein [Streptosporangium sp. NBC_01755]WSD01792.1 hypothetical protein OG884_07690 [Streptosporangium sp. NBC_01755]